MSKGREVEMWRGADGDVVLYVDLVRGLRVWE